MNDRVVKNRYEVGDRVVVRSDLVQGRAYPVTISLGEPTCRWMSSKERIVPRDRIVTIKDVIDYGRYVLYQIEEDPGSPGGWIFVNAFFEGLADESVDLPDISETSLDEILFL